MSINNFGFTAIEVIMVVAIFAIILSSAVVLTPQKTYTDALTAKTMAVVDLIDQAHNFAVSGYYDSQWGIIAFGNSSDCTGGGNSEDCFILFKGSDYSSRDSSYDRILLLDNGTYFSEDDEDEFAFDKVSGYSESTYSFIIRSNIGDTKTVYIKKTGLVYYTD